jgi:hypothetical protein
MYDNDQNVSRYTFKDRKFVDSRGDVIEYFIYHREEDPTLFLSIKEGCYDKEGVEELFDFLYDMNLPVSVENSNWID